MSLGSPGARESVTMLVICLRRYARGANSGIVLL
ncbi:Uncharacterised protein [Mycobacterium tuberculosis]|nr:Uncharacterised protein [Mycobacterium tuberculosis]